MFESTQLPYPIAGEISDPAWEQLAEGQPALLLHRGQPVAIVIDLDSWEEAELAVAEVP